MSKKQSTIKMSLDPTYNEISMSDLVVHSHDKNSYQLNFEFSDGCDNPLSLIDAKPRILFVLDNDIMQLYQLKIDSERLGEASFTFVEPLLHYRGIASAYVYVDYENKKHDVGGFMLKFKKSAIDGEMPEIEGYIEDIDKALKKVDELEGKSKEATDKLDGDIKDISKQIKDNDIVKKDEFNSATGDLDDFRNQEKDITTKMKNEFFDRGSNPDWFDDGLQGAHNDIVASYINLPANKYEISETTIKSKKSMISEGVKLSSNKKGLDFMFSYDRAENIKIKGINFDCASISRGSIIFNKAKNIILEDCTFTGYSADFGYYKTDSQVLFNECEGIIKFKDCVFFDSGFQYGTETETLNRCVTFQGEKNKSTVVFDNCDFNRINQGIVSTDTVESIFFNNCRFKDVRDNSFYLFGINYFEANNCYFDDKFDECAVFYGGTFIFRNSVFKNIPNKIFSINGDVEKLIIDSCEIDNSDDSYSGQPISFRQTNSSITFLQIKNSNFSINGINNSDIFHLGNIETIDIKNINIYLKNLSQHQRVFSFRGEKPTNGIFRDIFTIVVSNVHKQAMLVEGQKNILMFEQSNVNTKIRSNLGNFEVPTNGFQITDSVGPYAVGTHKNSIYFCDFIPKTGDYKTGDFVFNTNPKSKDSPLGWLRLTTSNENNLNVDWAEK